MANLHLDQTNNLIWIPRRTDQHVQSSNNLNWWLSRTREQIEGVFHEIKNTAVALNARWPKHNWAYLPGLLPRWPVTYCGTFYALILVSMCEPFKSLFDFTSNVSYYHLLSKPIKLIWSIEIKNDLNGDTENVAEAASYGSEIDNLLSIISEP